MEPRDNQGDQSNTQLEEHVHCSVEDKPNDSVGCEKGDETSQQCEKSILNEIIDERIEPESCVESSQPLPLEFSSDCKILDQTEGQNAAIAAQDLVSGFELPSALSTSPDHSEMFAGIIKTIHELKCYNEKLGTALTENCRVIEALESKCAFLEKKNEGLEKVVAKLMVTCDSSATDLVRLSTEVAGLIAVKCNGSLAAKSNEKVAGDSQNQVSPDLVPLPTVEQRIASLEVLTVESSTRLKDLAISVDHIERDLQRFIRRHSIIVENLCPKEDRSAQEAFLVFVNCVLHVSADESDIDGLHLIDKQAADANTVATGSPVKTASDHVPRAVLVTFSCYRTRMKVYKAWLSYRVGASGDVKAGVGTLSGERGQGVCIREYLTAAQELVYRAAMDARLRKPDLITDCWTFRGRAFVRTCHGDVREFSEVDQMITKSDSKYRSCSVM